MGNSEHTLKNKDGYGRNEEHDLYRNHRNQEGDDNLKISLVDSSEVFELQSLKNLPVSFKR